MIQTMRLEKTIQSEVPLEVEVYNETIGFFGGTGEIWI